MTADTTTRKCTWRRASAHARAAAAIANDPFTPPFTAATHLEQAWAALEQLAEESPDHERGSIAERDPTLGDFVASASAATRGGEAPSLAALRTCCHSLGAAVDATRAVAFDGAAGRAAWRRWVPAALGLAFAAASGFAVSRIHADAADGPWRAAYFAGPNPGREPIVVRRDRDPSFDWGEGPPAPGLPTDRFSVVWDACLALDAPRSVRLSVVGDDGLRLYVDGARLIDAWKPAARRAIDATATLEAGVHHVRLEYFDAAGPAFVGLVASFAGEPPAAIPRAMLHHPGDMPNPNRVCQAVDATH